MTFISLFNEWQFPYIGKPYIVELNRGLYSVELWGASGGSGCKNDISGFSMGGKGAYIKALLRVIPAKANISIFVGGIGSSGKCVYGATASPGGWNGGGLGGRDTRDDDNPGGGGGATDIRLSTSPSWNDPQGIASRVLVAAGGSGGQFVINGSPGGALYGLMNKFRPDEIVEDTRINQSSGYKQGVGKNGMNHEYIPSSGSGAGYYGGLSAGDSTQCSKQYEGYNVCPASSSGSSFIAGYPGCADMSLELAEAGVKVYGKLMLPGNSDKIPTNKQNGNGFAQITLLDACVDVTHNIWKDICTIIFLFHSLNSL